MYSFVIDHEKEMKIQLLNAVVLRGLGFPFEQMREDKAPSTSIRIFLNLQIFLCGFKNFPVHAYPCSNQICPLHVSGFILVPRILWEFWKQSMRSKAREICI